MNGNINIENNTGKGLSKGRIVAIIAVCCVALIAIVGGTIAAVELSNPQNDAADTEIPQVALAREEGADKDLKISGEDQKTAESRIECDLCYMIAPDSWKGKFKAESDYYNGFERLNVYNKGERESISGMGYLFSVFVVSDPDYYEEGMPGRVFAEIYMEKTYYLYARFHSGIDCCDSSNLDDYLNMSETIEDVLETISSDQYDTFLIN